MNSKNEIDILINSDGSLELKSQGLIGDELKELYEEGFENKTSLLSKVDIKAFCG